MEPFKELRRQAAAKRDTAIKFARDEYRSTVNQIKELERGMHGAAKRPSVKIIDMIGEVMPRNATWTLDELMELLADFEPGRKFKKPTVRILVCNLVKRGAVKRVSKGHNGSVNYAVADLETEDVPFGAEKLSDVCRQMIADNEDMNATEIAVKLREAGYDRGEAPRKLRDTVAAMLRKK